MMVEKPLAESVEAAQAAAAAVAGHDLVTMIAYSLRFDPRYVALREAISQGEIGDVLQITACRNPPASALTRIQGRVELPFWVGIHDIDMMRWITGSEVDRVTAIATAQTVGGWPVRRAYLALLTLANGVIASLENVWEETSAFDRPQSSAHFKVQGTQGMIEVAASAHGVTIRGRNNTTMPDTVYMPEIGGHVTGVYRNQIAAFIRCVREGRPSDIPLEDGLAGVRVAEAISLSARVGHEVVLNQSVNPTPISVNRNTSASHLPEIP
jgi:myo-inositol 2-dehydrogenase/D-chiro-inositol 1-dehydrogenase